MTRLPSRSATCRPTEKAVAANVADEQQNDATASGTTLAVSIVLAVGDFAEIFVTNDSGTSDSVTPTGVAANDGAGHNLTQTQVEHVNGTDNQSQTSYKSTQVTTAGTYTFTVTYSASAAFRGIKAKRIAGSSGMDTGAASHKSVISSFTGTGTDAVTLGNITPSSAGGLISSNCLCTHGGAPTITKGTGFTDGVSQWPNIGPCHSESLHVATTSARAVTYTSNQNNIYAIIAHTWLDVSSVVNTLTITDNITIADILAALKQLVRVVADLFTVSDQEAGLKLLTRLGSDSFTIIDSEQRLLQATRLVVDPIVLIDIETRFAKFTRNAIDAMTLIDIITGVRTGIVVRSIVDAFLITDVEARLVLSTRNVAELMAIVDQRLKIEYHTRLDVFALSDLETGSSASVFSRILSDPLVMADLQSRYTRLTRAPLADSFQPTDQTSKGPQSFIRKLLDAILTVDTKIAQLVPFSTAKTRVTILLGANDEPKLGSIQPIVLGVSDDIQLGSYQ